MVLGTTAVRAETSAPHTTVVVKVDAHSGRLVRSVVSAAPKMSRAFVPAPFSSADASAAAAQMPVSANTLAELIDAIAEANHVEAPLVHSVIKAESNYNPAAISPKGAEGLMQLIPSTAHRFGVSNSFNAQENVEGGVKYLKYLIELYQNDYEKVIAAYNAGEGAVAKYGGIPPYSETINYVLRVSKNLQTARQYAEQKTRLAAVTAHSSPQKTEGEEVHSIQASVAADGKVYYRTQ